LIIKVSLSPSTTPDAGNAPLLTPSDIQTHVSANVEGDPLPFTDSFIATLTDFGRIKKIYKLHASGGSSAKKGKPTVNGWVNHEVDGASGKVDEIRELEVAVLGAMALRGATN
jgi:EKC/KEOPS complex subunit CGI121/TPRKB